MILYSLNNVIIFFIMLFNRKYFLFFIMMFSVSAILFFLPETGQDYYFYKGDYDSSYLDSIFPYFHSSFSLDAEPFYKFYTSFIKIVTDIPFNGFLSLNYIICISLLFFILKKIFNINSIIVFFLFSLLTIVPTIFYFSPRSSISFVFAVFAFVFYVKEDTIKGVFFSFVSIGFHSQFIPILFILYILNLYNKGILSKYSNKRKPIILFIFIISVILIVVLKYPIELFSLLSFFISSLPSAGMIEGKLHYFQIESQGIRVTSLLSIIIFPLIFIISLKHNYFDKLFHNNILDKYKFNFILFLGFSLFFGMVVNILFINYSHIAGRISRFSDYTAFMILLPTLFLNIKMKNILLPFILIILILIVIIVYPTLYNFNLNIIDWNNI